MNEYIVEICQELITPVLVIARNKQEAKERAKQSQGEQCDTYPGEIRIKSVQEKLS